MTTRRRPSASLAIGTWTTTTVAAFASSSSPISRDDDLRGVTAEDVRFAPIDQEARMALARVVTFEGVGRDRIDEMEREMREGQQPEGLDASELLVLHDAGADKSLVIVFFETEEAYRRGDEVLNAMPAGETPGRRTSVGKYDVAIRMTP
jgi:hypothetical protein